MTLELLDANAFESFLSKSPKWIVTYKNIVSNYESTIKNLDNDWKGEGAEAFQKDARKVKANLGGIQDILETMCDTLQDCYDIFKKCDKSLKELNVDSASK